MSKLLLKPSFKEAFLSKYLRVDDLNSDEINKLSSDYPNLPVVDFCECMLADDDVGDTEALKGLGEIEGVSRSWACWASQQLENKKHNKDVLHLLLKRLGNVDEEGYSVDSLIKLLKQNHHDVDLTADILFALGKIGRKAIKAAPELLQIIKNSFMPTITGRAMWALGQMGASATASVILQKFDQRYTSTYCDGKSMNHIAMEAVAQMDVLPLLIRQLKTPMFRKSVVKTILKMGTKITSPIMQMILEDEVDNIDELIVLIEKVEGKSIEQILTNKIDNPDIAADEEIRAIRLLGVLNIQSRPVFILLAQIVQDASLAMRIREAAIDALGHMPPPGHEILRFISKSLKEINLLCSIQEAIGDFQSQASERIAS